MFTIQHSLSGHAAHGEWQHTKAMQLAEHQLLDGPRQKPLRTAFGVAGLLVFVILTLAGGNDVVALIFGVPVEAMTNILRVAIVVVPLLGFGITYRICRELSDRQATTPGHGTAVRLRRNPAGGFEEIEPD